jgi:hypothetical protein
MPIFMPWSQEPGFNIVNDACFPVSVLDAIQIWTRSPNLIFGFSVKKRRIPSFLQVQVLTHAVVATLEFALVL